MLIEIGNYSLALGVLAAAGGVLAAVAVGRLDCPRLQRAARGALYTVAGLLTAACAALMSAILTDDFRLAYVAGYSERALPVGYKLAAFWAGQEGSLLLWAWLLAGAASVAAFARRRDAQPGQTPALGILAALCGAFAALMLFAANPFQPGPTTPADGQGLNPMLQDPAMIAHPPMLFVGYAGFAVPFALLLGALLAGRRDNLWVPSVRRWVLGSWLFLTAGIVLGAQWAYVELGWGGYWAWDPVENASLLPWLTATALLHSLAVHQRRGMLKTANALLTAGTFLLCIFGTYLTRSGVISSVHAFPESPVGQFFLAMLAAGIVLSLAVIAWRRKLLAGDNRLQRLLSPTGAFLAADCLLVVMMLATMVGTIFPLITKPFAAHPVTLDAKYYNTVVVPMGVALAALMAVGPLLGPARSGGEWARRLIAPLIGAGLGAGASALAGGTGPWMLLCAAIAGFALFAIADGLFRAPPRGLKDLAANARRYGGQLVHLGVIMIVLGVAGSSLYGVRRDYSLGFGQSVALGRYTLRLDSLEEVHGSNYLAGEARVTLSGPGGELTVLRPQRRQYNKSQQANSEVAIYSSLREDVYLSLLGWRDRGQVTRIEAIVNPLVSWIWIGGIAMAVGSLICLVRGGRGPQPQEASADVPAGAPSALAAFPHATETAS